MTQGPSITEQAPGFAPLGATELRTCLIQLLLSLPPTQPMTIRVKPYQSRLDLLHHLCRLDRLVEEPLRLAPSPSRVARHASGILTATIQLGHFRIDLAGHLHLMLGLFPLALLDALKLALARSLSTKQAVGLVRPSLLYGRYQAIIPFSAADASMIQMLGER